MYLVGTDGFGVVRVRAYRQAAVALKRERRVLVSDYGVVMEKWVGFDGLSDEMNRKHVGTGYEGMAGSCRGAVLVVSSSRCQYRRWDEVVKSMNRLNAAIDSNKSALRGLDSLVRLVSVAAEGVGMYNEMCRDYRTRYGKTVEDTVADIEEGLRRLRFHGGASSGLEGVAGAPTRGRHSNRPVEAGVRASERGRAGYYTAEPPDVTTVMQVVE